MRCPGRNEDGVADALDDAVAGHPVLCVQSFPEFVVEVPTLIVNGVVMRFEPLSPLERHLQGEEQHS